MKRHPLYVDITVKGKVFPSLAELARHYGLNYQVVAKRRKAGWTPEEIALGKKSPHRNAQAIMCAGKQYTSLQALAREFGLPSETVRKRIKEKGWTAEQAVGLTDGPISTHSAKVSFRGVTYPSMSALARKYGVKKVTLRQRYKTLGWSLEESLGLAPHISKSGGPRFFEFHKRPQVCAGKKYNSIAQLAKSHGIKESIVRSRCNLGWTPEQAVGIDPPPAGRSKKFSLAGKQFNSAEEAAGHHEVLTGTFLARMKMGWTSEQAAGLKPPPRSVRVGGTTYSSIAHAAKSIGIHYYLVKQRLKLGWSIEEALGISARETPLHGGYSEAFFAKNPEQRNKPALLYFIRMVHRNTRESFFKIGITVQELKTRFRLPPYDHTTVITANTTLYTAWQNERAILDQFSKFKYLASYEGFSGRTECLQLSNSEQNKIKAIIKSLC